MIIQLHFRKNTTTNNNNKIDRCLNFTERGGKQNARKECLTGRKQNPFSFNLSSFLFTLHHPYNYAVVESIKFIILSSVFHLLLYIIAYLIFINFPDIIFN